MVVYTTSPVNTSLKIRILKPIGSFGKNFESTNLTQRNSAHVHKVKYILMELLQESHPDLRQSNLNEHDIITTLIESVSMTSLLVEPAKNNQQNIQKISLI